MIQIDLSSDTVTQPSRPMREAMATAKVGDEQRGEDPSVNELCARVAELLGHDSAIFLPSGIMCNQVAICVHCSTGDEVLTADISHILQTEGGSASAIAGAIVKPIPSNRGIFSVESLSELLRAPSVRRPRQRLVSMEQTSSRGGGAVWSLEALRSVCDWTRSQGLVLHLDGARLMNAAVSSGHKASDFAAGFDSAWLCLTKGLGCPVGAVLAGSKDFIAEAWAWKQRLGGAMRQAGIVAAAGVYALDHHIDRLAVDHANAKLLGDLISESSRIDVVPVDTNIVIFDIEDNPDQASKSDYDQILESLGVRIRNEGRGRYRAITHIDVDADQIQRAADHILDVVDE